MINFLIDGNKITQTRTRTDKFYIVVEKRIVEVGKNWVKTGKWREKSVRLNK